MPRLPLFAFAVALLVGASAGATTYQGNANNGFGGAVGEGALEITVVGDLIRFTLWRGSGDLNDRLVIYLDTLPGGYADTTTLSDLADPGRGAVSGGTDSEVAFPAGFAADLAIAFDASNGGFLYRLAAGGDNSLLYLADLGGDDAASAASFSFAVDPTDLGIAAWSGFRFVATYLNASNRFRSDEAIGDGLPPDNPGLPSSVTFTAARSFAALRLNELRPDQTSADNDEYVELVGPPGQPLGELTLIAIGDGTGGSGVVESVTPLTGGEIQPNGYFVIAESTFSLGTADLTDALNLENTDNVTYLLVSGWTGALNDDLDTDDDGNLDATPWTEVADQVAFVKEENPPTTTEYYYGPVALSRFGPQPPWHGFRCPDARGGWVIGSDDAGLADTPGAANSCPSIAVSGNGVPIAAGSTTPSTADGTDFGESGVRAQTFALANGGFAPLTLTGTPLVEVSGAAAADFVVTTDPVSPVGSFASTSFVVTFTPSAFGLRQATVSIGSDDVATPLFTFAVQGSDLDECTDGSATCSADATCGNTPGSYTCTCNSGFTGDGFTCADVDECTDGTDGCDSNATCANTAGSYTCTCNAGYAGDGFTCADVDECTAGSDTCDTNAACANTVGGYTCTCNNGFAGDGFTCADVDECTDATDGCDTNATCANTVGGYTCTCNSGFSGDGFTCADVDECTAGTDGCDANATCANTAGSYTCTCNAGYAGDGTSCATVCGDGLTVGDEGCDDGGTDDGDGCSASCAVEPGFVCAGSLSVCRADGDGDGIADEEDNCPAVANLDQLDADGDEIGDACDGPSGIAGAVGSGGCDCAASSPSGGWLSLGLGLGLVWRRRRRVARR